VEIIRLKGHIAVVGLVVAVFFGAASENARASATYSPTGPVSPAVDGAHSVSFSSTGDFLAAAGSSGPLSRYAIRQGGALEPLAPSNECAGSSVAFKPTGSVLASVDSAASTVTLCTVSRTDGSITPLGSPMPTGATPTSVEFSPDGKLLATTNVEDGSISMFSVGATTLAPVNDGEGFFVEFAGGPITSATFSPDSRFLLVTSGCPIGPTLTVYAIAADGSLSKVDAINPPGQCALDTTFIGTSNKFIAVATSALGSSQTDLVTYSLGPTGEILEEVNGTIPTGPGAVDVATSPDGKLVAYTNYQEDRLTLLQRTDDGAMTTAMSVSPGDGPSSVAFSADGTLLSVTTENDDSVELYHLAPGPTLLPAGAPTPLEGIASFMAVSSTDRVAVTTQEQDGVELFTLSSAGDLTRTATLGPTEVNTPHGVAFSTSGNLLAVAGNDGLSTYTVSAGGVPAHVDSAVASGIPLRVAFSPDGSLIATANYWDNSVSLFSVTPNGMLTPRGSMPTGEGPRSLAVSPHGSLLVTADELGGDVSVFGVSGTSLTAKPRIETGGNPEGLAFRPTDDQLAVVNYASQDLTTYAFDANGQATRLDSEHVTTPVWVSYSPSGDMLAAVDETDEASDPSTLWTFTVSEAGMLKPFGDPTVIDLNPYGVAFDATGRFILIPQVLDRDVWVYPLGAPVLDTVIKTGPAAYDNQTSPTFDFDASYPSTYECKLDSGSFAACDQSPTIQVAADGPHTLAVRARDALGNVDATPATYSWTRDTTPPSTPAPSTPLDGAANLAPATSFSWAPSVDALSGVSDYELLIDGTSRATVQPSTCVPTCTANVADLTNGTHTWSVRATDGAGNASQSIDHTFSVDAEAPGMLSLLAPIDEAAVDTARPTLFWLAAIDTGAGVDHYEVSVDGQALPSTTATSIQVPTALADGTHTWSLVAVDRVGNRSSPVSASFRTDTTPPIAHLAVGPRQTLPGISVVLDARESTDPLGAIADFSWDTNGDGVLDRDTGTDPVTTTTFPTAGTYHLTVQVTDQAGLTSSASVDVTITPAVSGKLEQGAGVRFIPPKATGSRLIRLVLTPPAGARAARISNDDDPNQPGIERIVFDSQAPTTTDWLLDPQTSPGKETKQVFVWFERGTELLQTSPTIILDEQPPQLSSATFSLSRTRTGEREATVRVRANDDLGTGIAKIRISTRCSGPFKPIKVKPRNGTYTIDVSRPKPRFRVTVRDAVGNTSRCVTARMIG
jgi:6-phosphogluconolactonase (cycloisomerase 2 family)